MRASYQQFRQRGAEVAIVTMGTPAQSAELCRRYSVDFPCLSSVDAAAYRAYGLTRGSVVQVMGPAVLFKGALAALRGNVGRQVGDVFQMPGSFIIDRTGIIRFCHRHADASDNISPEALLDALRHAEA